MNRFKSILIGMLAIAFIGTIAGCSEEAEAADANAETQHQRQPKQPHSTTTATTGVSTMGMLTII